MKRGFTLIEMLVVVAIIAILSGMVFWAMRESKVDIVNQAAERLASTLKQAQLLAMRSNLAHGVTFQIENAGDGSVLKNFSEHDPEDFPGRHWYAIIGPSKDRGNFSTMPPLAEEHKADTSYSYPLLVDYERDMQRSVVDEVIYLPRGTRFLALGDRDSGDTARNRPANAGYQRPWHGLFDPTAKRVWAWGAYHRDLETDTSSGTGLSYQRFDGIIPYDPALDTNVNPESGVWGQIHATATARHPMEVGEKIQKADTTFPMGSLKEAVAPGTGFQDNPVATRRGPDTTLLPGTPRPLINGWWSDCMLLFDFDGSCYVGSMAARRVWFSVDTGDSNQSKDRCVSTPIEYSYRETGGYTITICRDIDPDDHIGSRSLYDWSDLDPTTGQPRYDRLQSADDLLHSITPFARVRVPAFPGDPVILTSEHPDMHLSAADLLP